MRRASAAVFMLCVAGCGGRRLPGLIPDAAPRPATSPDGRFRGAALGWTLGGEVHLFVADSGFTRRVYARVVRPHLTSAPPSLDAAVSDRAIVSLAAESLAARPGVLAATILSEAGVAPAELRLIRLHASGDCLVPDFVTELVYAFADAARPAVPRSHTPAVGLLGFAHTALGRAAGSGDPVVGEDARRVIRLAALAAERLTAAAHAPPGWPLASRLAVDPDIAADAGEVVRIGTSAGGGSLVAVGFRVRFLEAAGDTVLVSGVALTDPEGRAPRWLVSPTRAPLVNGLLASGGATPPARYALRGVVFDPPGRPMLLIDRVADVSPLDSRTVVVSVDRPAVVAAQPLALRCR